MTEVIETIINGVSYKKIPELNQSKIIYGTKVLEGGLKVINCPLTEAAEKDLNACILNPKKILENIAKGFNEERKRIREDYIIGYWDGVLIPIEKDAIKNVRNILFPYL